MEFGKIFRFFWQQSYARLAKITLCMLDELIGEKQLCWESAQTFHHFRNSSKVFSEFQQEFSGKVVTTAFSVPRWSFFLFFEGGKWRKIYFFFLKVVHCYHFQTLCEKIFSTFAGMVTQACQKIVVHVQTKISTKKFFGGLILFSSFADI